MRDRILVKISSMEDGISIRTVSGKRKSPFGFYLLRSEIEELWQKGRVVSCDHHSFARLRYEQNDGKVYSRFCWLQASGEDELGGWKQSVCLPADKLAAFVKKNLESSGDKEWCLLSMEKTKPPRIVFLSQKNLHAALSNRAVRRKLVRFLRDHFDWPGADQICLYDDFLPYSFFFQELRNGESGLCGGVILHDQQDLTRARYSLHT